MAIKKTVDIEINTKNAVKSMEELGGTFEDVYGEVQPLSTKISEMEDRLYEMAGAGQTGTEEFKQMTAEIGKMKKVIIDTDLAVDGMSQTMAQNMGGALNGVASGFALGTGVMGAFGVESEKVEEMLLKVQSAMAISQGLQGVKESISSFKALGAVINRTAIGQKVLTVAQIAGAAAMKVLNAVMAANPVLLIVTGVMALAGALAWMTSKGDDAQEMTDNLNKSLEKQRALMESLVESIKKRSQHELAMLQATGAGEDELHKKRLEILKEDEKIRKAQMKFEKGEILSKQELYKRALAQGNEELATSIKDEIKQSRERYTELESQHEDYGRAKELEDVNYQKTVDAQNKANYDKYKQHLADKLALDREIEDKILQAKFDNEAKEQEANMLAFERFKEDNKGKTELIAAEEELAWQRRQAISDKWNEEINASLADGRVIELEELAIHEELKSEIINEAEASRAEKNAEFMQEKINQSQGYVDATMNGLQALDDLNSLLTDNAVAKAGANEAQAEAARKKGFERSKKLQLTMAVIQGVQGVMAAFTAGSSMGPAGVVMGPVMAALAAVTAGVNIAKISATKYEGGGGGGGASVPRTPSVPSAPSFNVVGNSGNNQLAETLGNAPPIKAQVVSSEVTSAQALDRNKIENASM